jgi:hypothetical protein
MSESKDLAVDTSKFPITTLIHISVEVIAFAGIIYYFSKQNTELKKQIEHLQDELNAMKSTHSKIIGNLQALNTRVFPQNHDDNVDVPRVSRTEKKVQVTTTQPRVLHKDELYDEEEKEIKQPLKQDDKPIIQLTTTKDTTEDVINQELQNLEKEKEDEEEEITEIDIIPESPKSS